MEVPLKAGGGASNGFQSTLDLVGSGCGGHSHEVDSGAGGRGGVNDAGISCWLGLRMGACGPRRWAPQPSGVGGGISDPWCIALYRPPSLELAQGALWQARGGARRLDLVAVLLSG